MRDLEAPPPSPTNSWAWPAAGRDPNSDARLERDDDSKKSHHALARAMKPSQASRQSAEAPICMLQDSYLNERETRVRNAATLPFSTFMSIFVTSATRKSRNDSAAVSTARRPASSHEVLLTPTTSTIL